MHPSPTLAAQDGRSFLRAAALGLALTFAAFAGLLFSTQTASYAGTTVIFPTKLPGTVASWAEQTVGRLVPIVQDDINDRGWILGPNDLGADVGQYAGLIGPNIGKAGAFLGGAVEAAVKFALGPGSGPDDELGGAGSVHYIAPGWSEACAADGTQNACDIPISTTSAPVGATACAGSSAGYTGGPAMIGYPAGEYHVRSYYADKVTLRGSYSVRVDNIPRAAGWNIFTSGGGCDDTGGVGRIEVYVRNWQTGTRYTTVYDGPHPMVPPQTSCGAPAENNEPARAYAAVKRTTGDTTGAVTWEALSLINGYSTGSDAPGGPICDKAWAGPIPTDTTFDVKMVKISVDGVLVYHWSTGLPPGVSGVQRVGTPYSICGRFTADGGWDDTLIYGTPVTYNESEGSGSLGDPQPVSFALPGCPSDYPVRTGWGIMGPSATPGAPAVPYYSYTAPPIPPQLTGCTEYQCIVQPEPTNAPGGCTTITGTKDAPVVTTTPEPCPPGDDGYCVMRGQAVAYNLPASECEGLTPAAPGPSGDCTPSGWENLNPLAWLSTLPCWFAKMFVPAPGFFEGKAGLLDAAWSGTAPGVVTDSIGAVMSPVTALQDVPAPTEDNCSGPAFVIPQLPTMDGPLSIDVLSTCNELTRYMLGIWMPVSTALVYLGGFFSGTRIVLKTINVESPVQA